mmetsp:Transcript_1443/g.3316  ORF Transcript_1443/g.3316 Transcript_1443/m.3316 type:complete len:302 (-) Transcript_1443:1443-2348(-)
MSTTGYFSSWWSGTKIVDSDEGIQTPKASDTRRPQTRSQNSREAKKRKTMDGASVADLFSDDKSTSLEDIAANLQTYLLHAEERQKKYEEQARRAEARTQRIESMLKRVLENQKKILKAEVEVESNEEEEEEQEETTPSRRKKRGAWSTKESELVSMGVRLYGRDMRALQNILEDRNRDQIRGFLRRNVRRLSEDLKEFPIRDESEKKALLEAIKRRQEDETEEEEDEEEDDDDDDEVEEGESEGNATSSNAGKRWTDEERQRLLEAIKIHGKEDPDALAAFVQTRSPKQTRMYIYRQLRD